MPEKLTEHEAKTSDPTVAKQWDDTTPTDQKLEDMYKIADKLGVCIMGTPRPGIGPVGRAMAVAKRSGPDFLFLANSNSQKFNDIESQTGSERITNLYFHDSSTQDWISVTGNTVTSDNSDPRIKEIYSKYVSAWFGDLGDGKHDGGPDDPRMKLIEVQPKYISYWQHEVGKLGFFKEIATAVATGNVAQTGSLRQLTGDELKQAREKHGGLSYK